MSLAQGRGGVRLETRIALAACVVLGCGLCGRAAAQAVRRRVRLLESLSAGIRALRIHMMGMLEPVQCALERSGCPLLAGVAVNMREGRGAGEAWRELRPAALRRGGIADVLNGPELEAVDRLFDRLGQSGREEQEALLGGALQTLEDLLEGARRKAGEADRLYLSMGLLIGLMLALIVI